MLQVGLTGNIATGKSHVSKAFAELGAHIIDADLIAHEILCSGTETYTKVVKTFGREILNTDGSVNRKALGSIVFSDPKKRLLLNKMMHPAIGVEIRRRIEALERTTRRGIAIIEAALMVEVGSHKKYHLLVVVKCRTSLQVARLVNRDNLSEEDAKARIQSQMAMDEKSKLADFIIDTSGTLKETQDQVQTIYKKLLIKEKQWVGHRC
ncbi:MAG: dephospho-CoA kinase [Acidobacteriota bacterium]